jgi:hypothetical protein
LLMFSLRTPNSGVNQRFSLCSGGFVEMSTFDPMFVLRNWWLHCGHVLG